MYFLYKGIAGFVINKPSLIYALAETGDFIGLVDLIPGPGERIGKTSRKFNCQCLTSICEFMTLEISDMDEIKIRFPKIFEDLFRNAR